MEMLSSLLVLLFIKKLKLKCATNGSNCIDQLFERLESQTSEHYLIEGVKARGEGVGGRGP